MGAERELSGKPAGLRTNVLICMGSALLMDLSYQIGVVGGERVGDPARIAAQVVSGIGFLGAGTIMQARGAIIGLTTAATIWTVAAIGLTVGAGRYASAISATVLVAIVLRLLGSVERRLLATRHVMTWTVRVRPGASIDDISQVLREVGLVVQSTELARDPDGPIFTFRLVGPARQFDTARAELLQRPDVVSLEPD